MDSIEPKPESLAAEVAAFLADNGSRDPHSLFRRVRETEPVFRTPHGFLLTRFADAQALFADPRFGRHEQAKREYGPMGDAGLDQASMFSNLDGEEHRRIRMLVNKAFAPNVVKEWQPLVAKVVAGIMDRLEDRAAFDILADIGEPAAETTVCEIMGVPPDKYNECAGWGKVFINQNRVTGYSAEIKQIAVEAVRVASAYFDAFIEEKTRNPDDRFVSTLIRAQEGKDRLSRDELIKVLRFIILGGTDNTANQLANGMWHLLRHRDQWEMLKQRPELAVPAVEEMLRFETSGRGNPRVALEDIELSGTVIPKGSTAFTFVAAVNRDPERFPDPDRFDITRPPYMHLAFAYGPHMCIGNHMARLILRECLAALAARAPDIELEIEHPEWRTTWIRAMKGLPVRRNSLSASTARR